MRRIVLLILGGASLAVLAQPMTRIPRWNSNPPMATTTSAPTTAPQPEYGPFDTGCFGASLGPGACTGQSKNAALLGAVHLNGCSSYNVTICGDGGTLSGAGTVNIWGWPEFPVDAGTLNLWAQNSNLTETITVASGTQCQKFGGHVADGVGWLYPAPSGVTVSAGVVSVRVEAACAN